MSDHADEQGQSDDALSADVRAFLARAERSHRVPDPVVKQRVRAAVGVALIAAPLGAAPAALHELGGATKLAARWSLGTKLGAAAVAATLAGTGGWLLPGVYDSQVVRSARSVSAPAASADRPGDATSKVAPSLLGSRAPEPRASTVRAASAPAVAVAPAALVQGLPPGGATRPAGENVGAEPANLRSRAQEPRASTVGDGLNESATQTAGIVDRSELSLLMAASDALDAALAERGSAGFDAREVERGLGLLAQHRDRFPHSLLEQERRGLGLVARCLRDGPPDARLVREASTFLRRFPGAVLTTRILRACGL
jgi:hypothetical protein